MSEFDLYCHTFTVSDAFADAFAEPNTLTHAITYPLPDTEPDALAYAFTLPLTYAKPDSDA